MKREPAARIASPVQKRPKTLLFGVIGVSLFLSAAVWAIGRWHYASGLLGRENESVAQNRPQETPSPQRSGQDQTANKSEKNRSMALPFYDALEKALANRQRKLQDVCKLEDAVSRRVLEDYGAMFMASNAVLPPPVCVFANEAEVTKFQAEAKFTSAIVGRARIELQPAAMDALVSARAEAHEQGLDITPRGGAEAARRSYADTLRLWDTRFLPALTYWTGKGRLSSKDAARLRQLPINDQVREVLELERQGIFFSKDLSKSILYSIAAPGTSQHTAMLALDVTQFGDQRIRRILAAHAWFQTVKSDLPHFTFLGVDEKDLPSLGLKSIRVNSQVFWVPNTAN